MAILTFHSIDTNISPGINNYSPRRLKNLLENLKSGGFDFVPLSKYLSYSDNELAGKISITFDDGYESFYINALPVLRDLKLPSTVFIPASFIGKKAVWDYPGFTDYRYHLSREQISECLKEGVEFGSHGLSHIDLTGISKRLLEVELRQSLSALQDITGGKIKYLSYPFGRFDDEVENCAAEAGYQKGFSLSYFKKSIYSFTRPRLAVYSMDTLFSVMNKAGGGLHYLEKIKGAVINAYSGGTVVFNKIRSQNISDKN